MVCGWSKKSSVDLGDQIKRIGVLIGMVVGFPVVLPFLGVDVIKECSTYTIADYEAAKSNRGLEVSYEDIGQCKALPASASGENVYVSNFRDFYYVYAVILVALIFIIPGYKILVY